MSRVSPPLAFVVIALVLALTVSCGGDGAGQVDVSDVDEPARAEPSATNAPDRVEITIGGLVIDAEVARTAEQRQLGLGGRDALPRDEGMLFAFEAEGQPSFWMRGMRFPLDFVWISSDGRVVDLTEDVPAPEPGVPDSELEQFGPSAPVLYVLEVNAGVVAEGGVQVGDTVTFDPEP